MSEDESLLSQALSVSGEALSRALLEAVKTAKPASIKDQQPQAPTAKERIQIWDAITRNGLAVSIMVMFVLANGFALVLIVWLAQEDQQNLVLKLATPSDRLVSKDVLISLLGATTVQLGSIAVIMANYVFKAAPSSSE